MIDVRGFNGGLNQDSSPELLPPGDYTNASNVIIFNNGVSKLLGNQGLTDLPNTPDGDNWVCGSHLDKTRQKIFYFIFNSEGYHRIVSVTINQLFPELSSSTILFEDRTNTGGSSIFGWGSNDEFNANKIIKDIKIIYRGTGEEGDLVYFIDPLKRPLKFNTVTLPQLASTDDVVLDYFKVIKAPPYTYPTCSYYDAPGRNVNNLRKKLFQFKSRFVYDDEEKSVWSAISKVPLPPRVNDDAYYSDGTKSNAISIVIPTGNKIVKKIEVAARVNINSVWSDFFLVDTLDKSSLSISNNSSYTYIFFNDGAYLPLEVEESNLLFDYVPDNANALELANGNTLVYGGIKEGLERLSNFDVTTTLTQSSIIPAGDISFIVTPGGYAPIPGGDYYATQYELELSGLVRQGDVINIQTYMIQSFDNFNTYTTLVEPLISYTVTAGQTLSDVRTAIISQINGSSANIIASAGGASGNSYVIVFNVNDSSKAFLSNPSYAQEGLYPTFIPNTSAGSGQSDSFSTLKWLGRYKYGIAYYSADGKTNGVFIGEDKNLTVDIPQYSEVGAVAQSASVQFSINHAPPSWASYYHFVRTKEITSSFSKYFITKGADITEIGFSVPYIYININNIEKHAQDFPASASIVNYTTTSFVKGDRLRFIKNQTSGSVLATHHDFEILGLVRRGTTPNDELFIKLAYVASNMPLFTSNTQFLIEIFRPSPVISDESTNFYYEIGERFPILTDVNNNLVHSGLSQNQIIGIGAQPALVKISDGDYYARQRSLTNTTSTPIIKYICMDAHFSDFWESAVWGQGRALVIDESAKTQYFPALLRFSQSFIQGTNINNLNRFYPENFEEADNSFGDILRLKTRENFIRIFQRYKVGMIPIFRSIIIDNATSSQVAISEKLLNKPNYYVGEYGIDKYGSSLVSTDYGDYFIDSINKAIVRVSLDGMTNISDTYNMSYFANQNISEDSYGYGYFDYERRCVILLIGNDISKSIISYSESKKFFESFHGYTDSTSFQFVNGYLWSFYGKPYVHNSGTRNNFYGVQQNCSITTVFNGNIQLKKTYTAIEKMSTELWNGVLITGPLKEQQTTISQGDYTKSIPGYSTTSKENKFNATIKRDINGPGGKYFGDSMKGLYARLELQNSSGSESRLISVSLKYIPSPLTNM